MNPTDFPAHADRLTDAVPLIAAHLGTGWTTHPDAHTQHQRAYLFTHTGTLRFVLGLSIFGADPGRITVQALLPATPDDMDREEIYTSDLAIGIMTMAPAKLARPGRIADEIQRRLLGRLKENATTWQIRVDHVRACEKLRRTTADSFATVPGFTPPTRSLHVVRSERQFRTGWAGQRRSRPGAPDVLDTTPRIHASIDAGPTTEAVRLEMSGLSAAAARAAAEAAVMVSQAEARAAVAAAVQTAARTAGRPPATPAQPDPVHDRAETAPDAQSAAQVLAH